jgi:hypothetical protein
MQQGSACLLQTAARLPVPEMPWQLQTGDAAALIMLWMAHEYIDMEKLSKERARSSMFLN